MEDPYNIQSVECVKLCINNIKMQMFIQEAKSQGIKVEEVDFKFSKRYMIKIGKCKFTKDIQNNYYDMFSIENGGVNHLITLNGDEPELALTAKYARDGDYIQISHGDLPWRWVFSKGKVIQIYPTLRWRMPKGSIK
jgi:hypothetical protein